MLGPADVDRRCVLRIRLGTIDVRPGRGMQDEVDVAEIGRRVRDVPVGPGQPPCSRKRLDERAAELAAGAGYDDVSRADSSGDCVLQSSRTRSSSQGMPCSSGFAASYSSVTRYAKRQSVSAS